MKTVLTCLLFFFMCAACAQWPFEYWHEGMLILDTSDTLRGKIKYTIDKDIIQLDSKGTLTSFTARKVVFYEILDATSGRYRQFYSIPFSPNNSYKTPVFFELLSEGRLTLLAREALEVQNTTSGFYGYGTVSRTVLVDKYFVLNEKGDIDTFSGKKPDMLLLMRNREDEIKKFIKTNRLHVENKSDIVRSFIYYNSLFKK